MTVRTPIARYIKDPDATLDYIEDWSAWLPSGDTIASATWVVPAGLTEPQASTVTTTTATVWLAGGAADSDYLVTCRVTTTEGRVDDRTIQIQVRER